MDVGHEEMEQSATTKARRRQIVWSFVLSALAATMFAAGMLLVLIGTSRLLAPDDKVLALALLIAGKVLGCTLVAEGVKLLLRSRRMRALSVVEVLRVDGRRPILYVRSFQDDVRSLQEETDGFSWWNPWVAAQQHPKRYEEVVARIMQPIGPVIAIGRPGEELPELGAARVYRTDDDWQEWVLARHKECSMVLLQAGGSQGLLWEVERVFRRDTFKPTLVCFPPYWPKDPPPEDSYRTFRRMLPQDGLDMPAALNGSYVLYFPEPHRAVAVPAETMSQFDREAQLAPGFGGIWELLEPEFPGVTFKAKVQEKQRRRRRVAMGVYGLAVVAGIVGFEAWIILS